MWKVFKRCGYVAVEMSFSDFMFVVVINIVYFFLVSHRLAATLLRSLCSAPNAHQFIKIYDGIPVLLSQLVKDTGKKDLG